MGTQVIITERDNKLRNLVDGEYLCFYYLFRNDLCKKYSSYARNQELRDLKLVQLILTEDFTNITNIQNITDLS